MSYICKNDSLFLFFPVCVAILLCDDELSLLTMIDMMESYIIFVINEKLDFHKTSLEFLPFTNKCWLKWSNNLGTRTSTFFKNDCGLILKKGCWLPKSSKSLIGF